MAVPVLKTVPSVSRTWPLPSMIHGFLEETDLQIHHYKWQDKCNPGETLTKPKGCTRGSELGEVGVSLDQGSLSEAM